MAHGHQRVAPVGVLERTGLGQQVPDATDHVPHHLDIGIGEIDLALALDVNHAPAQIGEVQVRAGPEALLARCWVSSQVRSSSELMFTSPWNSPESRSISGSKRSGIGVPSSGRDGGSARRPTRTHPRQTLRLAVEPTPYGLVHERPPN